MAKLRVTYTKSAIGYSQDQKDTVRSLGLRKLNSSAVHEDTPAIRGMIFKVRHLVTAEEVADATPKPRPAARRATVKLDTASLAAPPADDLEVIEGIGPKIAGVLRAAGISTFAQLAATSVASLSEILEAANLRLASPETWPEQAKLAAAGDPDALKQLQDRLKGGRQE